MRAKVQGTVLLQCVVRPDGTVGDVQVVQSLDPVFGLDQEAVKAARQWRFRPGTRFGEAVPVLITIELDVHASLGSPAGHRKEAREAQPRGPFGSARSDGEKVGPGELSLPACAT